MILPRRPACERAELVQGEHPPVTGDVLFIGPSFGGGARGARVREVRAGVVWFEEIDLDRWPVGAARWEFLPAVQRRGLERLRRRTG